GVDLLTGSRGNSLYTLSLKDMMASSPICLLSKASKTKSWLWHHRLSHLNFGVINHLARQGLVRALKDALRKLKGKALADDAVTTHFISPKMLNVDVELLNLRLLNNRITTTTEVPFRKSITVDTDPPKHVVTLVYIEKPRISKSTGHVSKSKVVKTIPANKKEPSKSWGSTVFNVPSSSLDECRLSKLFSGTVKFKNDHVAKIMGYGDYQIGKLCDSDLEVAFCQHTCFIRNVDGVYLLTGSRGNNLYTLSLGDMMASSPICLLSKASRTKSWLWHRRLSHLNFERVNNYPESFESEIRLLSRGPLSVNEYNGCMVNGFKFHTQSRETNRKTQHSGVVVPENYETNTIDFYGILQDEGISNLTHKKGFERVGGWMNT
nr:integrase, catalytic region, zinc finger, CCHC-type, peptidase aspartic, catalytic [Tanacetum cinerariifolium]